MKKLLLLVSISFMLGACTNEESASSAAEEGTTEHHESHSDGDSHEHGHHSDLNMEMVLDNDSDPSVLTAKLHMDDQAYEADRVRFEIIDAGDEENVLWMDGESQEDGVYTSVLENINPGTYDVVLHVNGPDELHEHTEKTIEIN